MFVRRSIGEVAGRNLVKVPKSKTSRRRIELRADDIEVLHERRAISMREGLASCEYVFTDCMGGLLGQGNFRRRVWLPLLKKAGIEKARFHDLRHTHASLMIESGIHAKVISACLGHSQIGITMDLYSHVMEGQDRQAAESVSRLLKRG